MSVCVCLWRFSLTLPKLSAYYPIIIIILIFFLFHFSFIPPLCIDWLRNIIPPPPVLFIFFVYFFPDIITWESHSVESCGMVWCGVHSMLFSF